MMHFRLILSVISSLLVIVTGQLETAYEWRYVDYVWPSEAKRQEAIRTGDYNYTVPIPMDVGVSQDGRVFVTMINVIGVPARLAIVTNQIDPRSGPLLQPYPSWDWTDGNSCDAIIKPFRIEIDRCNRLWVLDTGVIDLGKPRQCHAKLLAFDLWSDTLISKVILPENISTNKKTNLTLMANLKVETHGPFCEDTTVYMADSLGNALVIWDGYTLSRIEHPTFNPRPEATNFTVAADTSVEFVGILGLDLSPSLFPDEPQYLFFRPMASFGLFAIRTDQLKNSIHGQPIAIIGYDDVLNSQSIAHAFSSEGTLFLGSTKEIALVCWNRYREFNKQNLVTVAQDSERLQYADGIKVIPKHVFGEEEVWVITNRLMHYNHRNLWNPEEINFRILRSPVKKLIAGTKCDMPIETRYQLGITQGSANTHFG